MSQTRLTHLDAEGRVRMVDVGDKAATAREAAAEGIVRTAPETLALVGAATKGDVLATAEIAGVMAAKKTAELIPLCHALPLTGVRVVVEPDASLPGFTVKARVRTTGQTGVEMEALTAVSVACLTLYDMLKSADRGMIIGQIRLTEKSGGASGDYKR